MKQIKNINTHTLIGWGMFLLMLTVITSFKNITLQSTDPLAGWDRDILRQANSASGAAYLSADEKKLIFYTNLCRLKPRLFCQTVLYDYLNKHPDPSVPQAALANLKQQLIESKSCMALLPDEQLSTIAHDFAKQMGEEGKEGHGDFQNRMAPVMNRYNLLGENCDYSNPDGLDALMHLLIDKSDPVHLAHRKNILDPRFTVIGVSKQPHKTLQWIYVMDFGGK